MIQNIKNSSRIVNTLNISLFQYLKQKNRQTKMLDGLSIVKEEYYSPATSNSNSTETSL